MLHKRAQMCPALEKERRLIPSRWALKQVSRRPSALLLKSGPLPVTPPPFLLIHLCRGLSSVCFTPESGSLTLLQRFVSFSSAG